MTFYNLLHSRHLGKHYYCDTQCYIILLYYQVSCFINKITVCLTSILLDVVYDMLLISSLQGCNKLVALFFWSQQIQHGVSSSVRRSPLTANIVILSAGQNAKAEQLIKQAKVWLYYVWQSRPQLDDWVWNNQYFIWKYHITLGTWNDYLSLSLSLSPCLRFNGHFPGLAGVYWSKGWCNHCHQQTNTQMPFLSPNQQCQSTEGKWNAAINEYIFKIN